MANIINGSLRGTIYRLKPYLTNYKTWLILVWGTSFANAVMEIVKIYLLQALIDSALTQQNRTFYQFVILALIAMIVYILIEYFMQIVAVRYEAFTIRDLRNKITSHLQKIPISNIERFHSGDIVSRLNTDINKIAVIPNKIGELVKYPVTFIIGMAYLYFLSWKLLLATCFLIPLSAFLHDKVVRPMQTHAQKELEHLARANALTQDAVNGIYIIKAFNLQSLLTGKYREIAEAVRKEGLSIKKRAALELVVFLMLRYTPQLVTPLYGGYLAYKGEISPGALVAGVSLIWMLFIPVEIGLSWLRQLRETAPAVERVFEILDQPSELVNSYDFQIDPQKPAIIFNSVHFEYDDQTQVLDNFNLTVEKNRMVALVGSSGCGKSTVLKLVCGFYRPTKGQILVGGQDIFKSSISDVRTQISLVSQDTYLFPTTIAENIGYGRLNASFDEIVEAAKSAKAHRFIMEQPEGYQTQIGEMGVRLSGGQRQRISIARAILKNAPILLLDEPTAALDTQTEANLQEVLERFMQGRTVLVVAHRLTTIKNADQIVVLEKGKIHEVGTHETLMQADSVYKRLYLKQMNEDMPHV